MDGFEDEWTVYEDEWMGYEYGACMSIVDGVMVVGDVDQLVLDGDPGSR